MNLIFILGISYLHIAPGSTCSLLKFLMKGESPCLNNTAANPPQDVDKLPVPPFFSPPPPLNDNVDPSNNMQLFPPQPGFIPNGASNPFGNRHEINITIHKENTTPPKKEGLFEMIKNLLKPTDSSYVSPTYPPLPPNIPSGSSSESLDLNVVPNNNNLNDIFNIPGYGREDNKNGINITIHKNPEPPNIQGALGDFLNPNRNPMVQQNPGDTNDMRKLNITIHAQQGVYQPGGNYPGGNYIIPPNNQDDSKNYYDGFQSDHEIEIRLGSKQRPQEKPCKCDYPPIPECPFSQKALDRQYDNSPCALLQRPMPNNGCSCFRRNNNF